MVRAAPKYRDKPHARIYRHWFDLPAWKAIRPESRLLLVHMLAEAMPAKNGRLEWPLTRVQAALACSRATASASLTDLEKNGWIAVCRAGKFSGSRKPSLYRVTAQPSEPENQPATEEFLHVANPPHVGRKKNQTGFNKADSRFPLEPRQVSVETATAPAETAAAGPPMSESAKETGPLPPLPQSTPNARGKPSTQLLSTSALVQPFPLPAAASPIIARSVKGARPAWPERKH